MVKLILAGRAAVIKPRIHAASKLVSDDTWTCRNADSMSHAAQIAKAETSAILFFEFSQMSSEIRKQIADFRKEAPLVPICAAVPARNLLPEEITTLIGIHVGGFADAGVLADPSRLFRLLTDATDVLTTRRLRLLLQPRLTPSALRYACALLEKTTFLPGEHGPHRRVKAERGYARRDYGEPFAVALRLLFLVVLVETCGQPLSTLFPRAGFPSADDARKLLLRYSGVHARDLQSPESREAAKENLIAVLAGGTPQFVRIKDQGSRIKDQGSRIKDQAERTRVVKSCNSSVMRVSVNAGPTGTVKSPACAPPPSSAHHNSPVRRAAVA